MIKPADRPHVDQLQVPFPTLKGILVFSTDLTRENVMQILAKLAKLGFDTIFYVVKNYDGHVMYESHRASTTNNILGTVCGAARQFGLKVIAWFCSFTEGYVGRLDAHGISDFIRENPETAAVDRYGRSTLTHPVPCDHGLENYLCPLNPVAVEYVTDLMFEVAAGYPVFGIHLDFVRFPYPGDYCYCEVCQQKFLEETGEDLFNVSPQEHLRWKQTIITRFVERAHHKVKSANPEATISALVWRYPDCFEKTQNPTNWTVDFVTPLLHHRYYMKSPAWLLEEIPRNEKKLNQRTVSSIGGTASHHMSKLEWSSARENALRTGAGGYLLSHYGLIDVLNTLEDEPLITSLGKELRWHSYRLLMEMKRRAFG
jgi:hypothetical protein